MSIKSYLAADIYVIDYKENIAMFRWIHYWKV